MSKKAVIYGHAGVIQGLKLLGEKIVEIYHGDTAAKDARAEFERVFASSAFEIPDDIPEFVIEDNESHRIVNLAHDGGIAKSNGEARRKIREGALKFNGEKITDEMMEIIPKDGDILSIGKRLFVKIVKP